MHGAWFVLLFVLQLDVEIVIAADDEDDDDREADVV